MENFITEVDILDESKDCFLDYSEEVLTDRSVPSAEDGLLSVQRKLIWTMEEVLKMNAKSKYKKSASVVGTTLATSYYHGDAACYGALCKITQPYLMRYPLTETDGNMGTQEGNGMEASSRYTNVKPSKYADLMMDDFKKKTVPLKETYNGEYEEPVVLPGLFPNALCNGRETIAIGLAHNSLPNNLTEVCEAAIAYIDDKINNVNELMEYMKGPDFPLKNTIINAKDIKKAYDTGKSSVSLKVRGEYEIKGNEIIFSTIPYRTYRNKIKEQITKNIDILSEFIDDFADESNVGVNKLIFTVKKDVDPNKAVLKLFALTDLQTTLSYNMNYIVNGTPKMCSMLDLLKAYVEHQINVLINSTKFDLAKAEARLHIVEGLLIALEDLDNVIALIKASENSKEAKKALIEKYNIDDEQAKAILAMKLSSLANMERIELETEHKELLVDIEKFNAIINDKQTRNNVLKSKIQKMKEQYGDERRTILADIEVPKEQKEIAEVIPEDMVVVLSQSGEIKRIPTVSFKTQRRGGKGTKSESEAIMSTISTNTVDTIMFFTNKGKMYRSIVDKLPLGTNVSKGMYVSSLLPMDADERVINVASLHSKHIPKYAIFITEKGMIKKTLLTEYTEIKKSTGIQAIKLAEGDSIANVNFMDEEEIVVATRCAKCIRFGTSDVRATQRVSLGVRAISLNEGDKVVAGLPIHKLTDRIAVINEAGLGKKMDMTELTNQRRAGKGVQIGKEPIVGIAMVDDDDKLLVIADNTSICFSVGELPTLGRTAAGNTVIKANKVKKVIKL